ICVVWTSHNDRMVRSARESGPRPGPALFYYPRPGLPLAIRRRDERQAAFIMTTNTIPVVDTGPIDSKALEEPQLIAETGVASGIAAIAAPVLTDLGFRLVRVNVSGHDGCTVQIMVERPDGTMAIEECEAVSRALSPVLDVADPIDRTYRLEISSPGLDRLLVRRSDFERHIGQIVKIELATAFQGRRRYRGTLVGVDSSAAHIRMEDGSEGATEVQLPFDEMISARLVLTDDLIAAALRRGKSGGRALRRRGGSAPRDDHASHQDMKNERASGRPPVAPHPEGE